MTRREAQPRTSVTIDTLRLDGEASVRRDDRVAVEAPLGIELDGRLVATTMRTPGDDRALALGFLFAEGLVGSKDAVLEIVVESAECDLVRVRTREGRTPDVPIRLGTITSACGACGRVGLEEILASVVPRVHALRIRVDAIREAHVVLAALQPCYSETGGVHAAAIFTADGRCLASAEDVGRHNAVDKAIGRAIERGVLAEAALLAVSGRTSFEIVHKAHVAGIGTVAGVSAPSSLAIAIAERAGMVLAGFVRGRTLNVYAHANRLADRET